MDHILQRQENALLTASSTYGSMLRSLRAAADATGITNSNGSSEVCSSRTPVPPSNPSASERCRRLNSGASHESSPPPKTPLLSPKKPPAHNPARVHMPGIRLDATQTPLMDCYLSPEVAIERGAACTSSLHGDEAAASSGSLEFESKQRRICPSTMPSSNVHNQMDFVCPPEPDDIAITSVAASQESNLMRLQLGSWLNIGKRKFGVCVKNAFYLVRISFPTETSALTVDAVAIGATPICIKKQVAYSANQVKALVQQLEPQQTTRDQLMIQEVQSQLPPRD